MESRERKRGIYSPTGSLTPCEGSFQSLTDHPGTGLFQDFILTHFSGEGQFITPCGDICIWDYHLKLQFLTRCHFGQMLVCLCVCVHCLNTLFLKISVNTWSYLNCMLHPIFGAASKIHGLDILWIFCDIISKYGTLLQNNIK